MTNDYKELWAQCCQYIKDNISPAQYATWFRDIEVQSYDVAGERRRLVLKVQSSFFVDQLEERFQGVLRSGVRKTFGEGVQIVYCFRRL